MDVLRAMLHGFETSGFLTGGDRTPAGAAKHVRGLESGLVRDGKKRFDPPNGPDAAVKLVLQQAQALGQAWTD